jgi:FkbM family methyltransferase
MATRLEQAVNKLPLSLRRRLSRARASLFDVHASRSYSQEGEDMILRRMFATREHGYYVDVGAHHPRRFSNTFYFYKRGWHGINIEPNPEAMALFMRERKRDLNLQLGVAERPGRLTYYQFDEPALNTFDALLAESRLATTHYRVTGKIDVPVRPLADVLAEYVPFGQSIDVLTIDVEGLDFAVLRSNDWERFRPTCVLVEALEMSLERTVGGDVHRFMSARGYELFAKTVNTLIFRATGATAATGASV